MKSCVKTDFLCKFHDEVVEPIEITAETAGGECSLVEKYDSTKFKISSFVSKVELYIFFFNFNVRCRCFIYLRCCVCASCFMFSLFVENKKKPKPR